MNKRNILLITSIILLTFAATAFAKAQPAAGVFVKAYANKTKVKIGENIEYRIVVKTNKDTEIELPKNDSQIGKFAVLNSRTKKHLFFNQQQHLVFYTLNIYEIGKQEIPEVAVKYKTESSAKWLEEKTNKINMDVVSVLATVTDKTDVRDIKGPVFALSLLQIILILVFIIFIAALITAFIIVHSKKAIQTILKRKPAHEIAYEELKQLRDKDYISKGQYKEFYSELSFIVRRYLENRFNLKAPEMTTEEFMQKAKESQEISYEHKNFLKEFLSYCDIVKFAKHKPTENDIQQSIVSAERLVDQTKHEPVEQNS